ncbi:MAG TPA: hypothetical protein VNA69_10155 [Thermoanaerobaculia bacterium]|nr:hypothetical protein [Thermoanaerobaculia bacterium]
MTVVRDSQVGTGSLVLGLGLVANAFGTVQIDLNVVHKITEGRLSEITLCDHNCTIHVDGIATGGNYTCPAAMSLNRGARRTSLAPSTNLVAGLKATITGILTAQQKFLAGDLAEYFDREGIPESLRSEFTVALSQRRVVVNLFGGSPESHPDVLDIIAAIKAFGAEVHLTTTGRRILRDGRFREDFLTRPPDVLGLGADDFDSPDDIDRLFSLDYDKLSELWKDTPWQHGQRRKAIEAVQLCKLAQRHAMPQFLFNIVLHPGNLRRSFEVMDRLARHTPNAILNPYPVQTAFLGNLGELDGEQQSHFSYFVDAAIAVHLDRQAGKPVRWNLAPRLGYWILMRALLDQSADTRVISDQIGGQGVWRCYSRRGAGRCVQVGVAAPHTGATEHPGGHLGCFWNTETITDSRQFWTLGADEVANWVLEGRQAAAAAAPKPCGGCLFPRMSMDAVSLELGLTPAAASLYRAVRARHLGY